MIIRLITPTKQLRVTVDPESTLQSIVSSNIDCLSFTASLDPSSSTNTLQQNVPLSVLQIKNGNCIYIKNIEPNPNSNSKPNSSTNTLQNTKNKQNKTSDGMIHREKSIYCNHSSNAMCPNCAPLDPFDKAYHQENKIKYLSYNSYLAMLKQNNIELETSSYEKKVKFKDVLANDNKKTFPCRDRHGSNTACLLCMPQTIYLQPQIYRMIDHIEYENKKIVDDFIGFWRKTGKQRFGYLVGRECEYNHVPLGKKVLVCAIFEPKQKNFPDGFILDDSGKNKNENTGDYFYDSESMKALKYILDNLGLKIVGMIYTNISKREHTISSLETDFIASKQLQNLYYCEEKKKNHNSKFVTVIIHNENNDLENGIDIKEISDKKVKEFNIVTTELMVSNQAMSLKHTKCILPTEDPTKMIINKDSNTEIFYRGKNEYGIVEKIKGDPYIPLEFFWVRLTHGYTENTDLDKSIMYHDKENINTGMKDFSWEDSLKNMGMYFNKEFELEKFMDLDVLVRIVLEKEIFDEESMKILLESVRNKDVNMFNDQFTNTSLFVKLTMKLDEFSFTEWSCKACTFINNPKSKVCEMCESKKL